jgi:hypothetical protein
MIQAYDAFPLPKSMTLDEVKAFWPWREGTKIEDGGEAWIVLVPAGEPFEGSIK